MEPCPSCESTELTIYRGHRARKVRCLDCGFSAPLDAWVLLPTAEQRRNPSVEPIDWSDLEAPGASPRLLALTLGACAAVGLGLWVLLQL